MKKFRALLLTTLLLWPTLTFAQSSPGATSPVDKNKVIARLLGEIDAGRALLGQLEEREKALSDELAAADDENKELTAAHRAALLELGELRATIKFQKDALGERERQVGELRSELAETRTANKKLRKENRLLKAIIVGGAAVAVRLLF